MCAVLLLSLSLSLTHSLYVFIYYLGKTRYFSILYCLINDYQGVCARGTFHHFEHSALSWFVLWVCCKAPKKKCNSDLDSESEKIEIESKIYKKYIRNSMEYYK